MARTKQPQEISKEEVWNVIEYANALYSQLQGFSLSDYYNPNLENKLLIDANNNPLIPTNEKLRNAIANYKDNGELLKAYSEFMEMWDGIYKQAIDYKLNLLAFDISHYCINIKDDKDYQSQEYRDDVKRVKKFLENFATKQQFRQVVKQMLINDVYFVWLRDSEGSFDDNIEDLTEKKSQCYSLQTMPQKYCKITGEFTAKNMKGKGFLWDFDLNYFLNSNVNILNYDPSLIRAFDEIRQKGKLKSFIVDNNAELNKVKSCGSTNYVRTKVNKGSWCFKYNDETVNIKPPLAYLLKSVFPDDLIEKLQRDKDIISANAIILGELKTRDKDNVGNNKNAFTIDPKQVGQLMKLARNGIDKNIKQIALPLEETRLYQFADNNSNMYKNTLSTNAGLSAHNSTVVFTTDKLAQEQAQIASAIDYNSIAMQVYPQFENFLNFFVNKKTKKFKFRFRVDGSNLPFMRKKNIDNHLKLSDKGIQVPLSIWGNLLGYEANEFECYIKQARYESAMQDDLFLLMNTNTSVNEISTQTKDEGGRPEMDNSDLSESGSVAKEYD